MRPAVVGRYSQRSALYWFLRWEDEADLQPKDPQFGLLTATMKALIRRAGSDGEVSVHQRELANAAQASIATLAKSLRTLERLGLIECKPRMYKGRGYATVVLLVGREVTGDQPENGASPKSPPFIGAKRVELAPIVELDFCALIRAEYLRARAKRYADKPETAPMRNPSHAQWLTLCAHVDAMAREHSLTRAGAAALFADAWLGCQPWKNGRLCESRHPLTWWEGQQEEIDTNARKLMAEKRSSEGRALERAAQSCEHERAAEAEPLSIEQIRELSAAASSGNFRAMATMAEGLAYARTSATLASSLPSDTPPASGRFTLEGGKRGTLAQTSERLSVGALS